MMPLVVTEAPRIATYSSLTFVLDNAGRPERGPCSGSLSCCSAGHSISIARERKSIPCDKISMQSVLEKLYAAKMKSLANSLLEYNYTLLETTIAVEREKPTLEEFVQKWRISGHQGRNHHDLTLLGIAAFTGNDPIVRELLEGRRKGEPWYLVDKNGLAAFHMYQGYVAIFKFFLETGDFGKEQIDGYNTFGAARIHQASEYGCTEMLRLLLANDAEVDLPKRPCSAYAGRTALHCAAERSQFECCEILIRHGASVHTRDAHGATVLHMAALEPRCLIGNQDPNAKMTTVRLLLEDKADPSVRNDAGHTAAELLALASGHSAGELWLALCTHDPLDAEPLSPSEITGSHQADSGTSAEFVGPSEITGSHQADSGTSAEFVEVATRKLKSGKAGYPSHLSVCNRIGLFFKWLGRIHCFGGNTLKLYMLDSEQSSVAIHDSAPLALLNTLTLCRPVRVLRYEWARCIAWGSLRLGPRSCDGAGLSDEVPRESHAAVPVSPTFGTPWVEQRGPSKSTLTPALSVNFPMKCVRVMTFMEFDVMPSYGELLAKNLLVEPSDNATVHLISHEWLSRRHPDPDSNQLRRMQGVFLEILAGRFENLFSKDDWITFSKGASIGSQRSQLAAAESAHHNWHRISTPITEDTFKQDIEEGLIWLDWSSIPQVLEVAEDKVEQTFKDQLAAIHSIGAYVDRSSYFWILAPKALHKDQKTLRDFSTYRTRAWCRLEEWANLLSSSPMMPLVVTEAPRIATYSSLTFILDNAGRPERGPCSGQLSCCSSGHSISIAGERKSIPCDKISMQSVLEKLRISGHQGRDEHDSTLLHIAAQTGNHPMVRELLERQCKGEPWLVDSMGHAAFQLNLVGSVATEKLFLETGDISKAQMDGYNKFGAARIHMTSEYGRTEMLRLLLASDAEVDLPKRQGSAYAGRTALHCAALRSQFECCEILIRHSASVHARDAHGATVLHMAALEPRCLVGNQDPNAKMTTVRLLLEAKADPSVRNDAGHTAAELLALASGHSAGELWLALCTHDPLDAEPLSPSEITGSHQADSGTSAEFVGPSEITGSHQADSGTSAEFVEVATRKLKSGLGDDFLTVPGVTFERVHRIGLFFKWLGRIHCFGGNTLKLYMLDSEQSSVAIHDSAPLALLNTLTLCRPVRVLRYEWARCIAWGSLRLGPRSCDGAGLSDEVPRESHAAVPVSPTFGTPWVEQRGPSKSTLTPALSVNFPMKCVRVMTFMEFDVMPSYGELLAKDLLVEPSDNATVHLISHEWLSRRHPDPDSNQLRRMQGVFLEILAGRFENLFSKDDWITFSKGASIGSQRSQLAAAESAHHNWHRISTPITEDTFKQDIEEGLIWLDWSSIPQVLEVAEDKVEQTFKDQLAAIHSIGAYVDRSSYFWILAPKALHKDQKTLRDFSTYRTRAWCRLEEWANLLSSSPMMPLVVTEAPRIATYSSLTFILDNAGRPERGPCSGQLSCCSSGHSISIAGERKSIPCDKISMQSVLEKLRISGHQGRDEHDSTLLHIAAQTGNHPMVRELLERRCKGEPWLVDSMGHAAFQLNLVGSVATEKLFLETGDLVKRRWMATTSLAQQEFT
ncbi:unnamed protein product [Polarella glacialis]|uniref:Uncharacterized protein n=1 Tax=Polarella glacialis TaxID=89957 RepID=A0A813HPJ0_POLGL|nr:unnamed protein product [Polarella glacialis]